MIIVGLGNPGVEYEHTRHNAGRDGVLAFAKKAGFDEFEMDKKSNALVSVGKVGKTKITLVLPETFMNKSGSAIPKFIKSVKSAMKDLVVVHDDLDIPLGRVKLSYNKSSGGHKGVESVMRAVKTESFGRIRVGVTPTTASGKMKKPEGKEILDFIIGKWKKNEEMDVKIATRNVVEALTLCGESGFEAAMGEMNSRN